MEIGNLRVARRLGEEKSYTIEDERKVLEVWHSVQHKKAVIALIKVCQKLQLYLFSPDDPEEFTDEFVFFNFGAKSALEMVTHFASENKKLKKLKEKLQSCFNWHLPKVSVDDIFPQLLLDAQKVVEMINMLSAMGCTEVYTSVLWKNA